MVDSIVCEVINDFLKEREMIKEHKNPKDSETVRVCADMLENLHNEIVKRGASKNEYNVKHLLTIVEELRKLQEVFKV